jgi:hypothetical protein
MAIPTEHLRKGNAPTPDSSPLQLTHQNIEHATVFVFNKLLQESVFLF